MSESDTSPECDVDESLWAISREGVIWQINPLSRYAAPVLHLDELAPHDRQNLRHHLMRCWRERGDPSPPDIG